MNRVRTVPWWGLLSAAAAPVFLIGGWTVAAQLQPGGFDSVRDTISDLAALGASERWVMTSALGGVGVCHATTALALRAAAPLGRAVLASGGVATVLVAAAPLPVEGDGSVPHSAAAAVAFGALSVWPALAWRRGSHGSAWPLRPRSALLAASTLLGLVSWFAAELSGDGGRVGLAERVAAGAQAVWPLVVVVGVRAYAARQR